jgi:glycerol uptake facilitator-like aquaporin
MSTVRRLSAEGIGSALLAAAVVGSGVMAERLAGGNTAVALLANTGATVAVLATLIALLGPVSGAHFNPAVSLVEGIRGRLSWRDAGAYIIVQILGCCFGVILAHAMFELRWLQSSAHTRTGFSQWLAEGVATFGLLLVVLGHRRPQDAAWMVAAWQPSSPRSSSARCSLIRSLGGFSSSIAYAAGSRFRTYQDARRALGRPHDRSARFSHDLSQPRLRHLAQHACVDS